MCTQITVQTCYLMKLKQEMHEVSERMLMKLIKKPQDQTNQRMGKLASEIIGHS